MEIEVSAEAKDKNLNRMVAITFVVLSVFTGVCNIKDGNLVQGCGPYWKRISVFGPVAD